jgi:hypothetical protein
MSRQQTDNEFRACADAFIRLADEQRHDAANDKVNASLLYAATRFHAFVVASAAQNADEMREDKEEAIRYFSQKVSEMLSENIDDYIANHQD